jgi:hypothetical protein
VRDFKRAAAWAGDLGSIAVTLGEHARSRPLPVVAAQSSERDLFRRERPTVGELVSDFVNLFGALFRARDQRSFVAVARVNIGKNPAPESSLAGKIARAFRRTRSQYFRN